VEAVLQSQLIESSIMVQWLSGHANGYMDG